MNLLLEMIWPITHADQATDGDVEDKRADFEKCLELFEGKEWKDELMGYCIKCMLDFFGHPEMYEPVVQPYFTESGHVESCKYCTHA